jgi:hypothetical protein
MGVNRMRKFILISTHYFKKNILDPTSLLLLGLPLVFIFTFGLIESFLLSQGLEEAGIVLDLAVTVQIVLAFQFFGASCTTDWLHSDMKGAVRARLLVTGINQRLFNISVIAAGWIFNVIYGMILVGITSVFFDTYWGSYFIALIVIALISLLSQIAGALIFYMTKDEKTGSRVAYFFGEIMIGLAIIPFAFNVGDVVRNIGGYLPIGLGVETIEFYSISEVAINLGILLGYSFVLAIIVYYVSKRKQQL